MLARYLAALHVILPQLDTIDLRGVLLLCILGVPYNFGCSSESGHSFQYNLSEMDPISLPLPKGGVTRTSASYESLGREHATRSRG